MGNNKKKKPSGPTTVRLPDDLREAIEDEARQQETNSSAILRKIVRSWDRNKRKSPDMESETNG